MSPFHKENDPKVAKLDIERERETERETNNGCPLKVHHPA